MFSPEKRRLQENLIAAFQYFKGVCKNHGEAFTKACSDRTRGSDHKLKESRFRLDRRKILCTMRPLEQWNRLLREVMAAPSLEVFKVRFEAG